MLVICSRQLSWFDSSGIILKVAAVMVGWGVVSSRRDRAARLQMSPPKRGLLGLPCLERAGAIHFHCVRPLLLPELVLE